MTDIPEIRVPDTKGSAQNASDLSETTVDQTYTQLGLLSNCTFLRANKTHNSHRYMRWLAGRKLLDACIYPDLDINDFAAAAFANQQVVLGWRRRRQILQQWVPRP